MKVRLKDQAVENALNVDDIYRVIAVSKFNSDSYIAYVLLTDHFKQPRRFKSTNFEVVDDVIEPFWVFNIDGNSFSMCHSKMSYASFWEDFFDGEPTAVNLFKELYPEFKVL